MIFVTVGSEIGFDRLTRAVDAWAARHGRDDVFMQIADGQYVPKTARWTRFLDGKGFEQCMAEADCVVAHAGTGTILSCMGHSKPLLLMPRTAALKETRNDHQIATCRRFEHVAGISVAWQEDQIDQLLDQVSDPSWEDRPPTDSGEAGQQLTQRINQFIGERVGKDVARVLCVSSGGGHWSELQRLLANLASHDLHLALTKMPEAPASPARHFHRLRDATRWDRWGLLRLAGQVAWLLIRVRPHVIITTGAAPGYFALRLGRMLGSRTLWLDSFANAEELSLSGQKAGGCADLWLTQWPHLAQEGGPSFAGSVLPLLDSGAETPPCCVEPTAAPAGVQAGPL